MTAIPLPENITGVADFTQYINTASQGWFWTGMLMTFTLISFLWLATFGFRRAATTALFASTIIAIPLRLLSVIDDKVLFTYAILTGIMIVVLYFSDET